MSPISLLLEKHKANKGPETEPVLKKINFALPTPSISIGVSAAAPTCKCQSKQPEEIGNVLHTSWSLHNFGPFIKPGGFLCCH
jgi:hypothetical protein